jgi:hypothetical protein
MEHFSKKLFIYRNYESVTPLEPTVELSGHGSW